MWTWWSFGWPTWCQTRILFCQTVRGTNESLGSQAEENNHLRSGVVGVGAGYFYLEQRHKIIFSHCFIDNNATRDVAISGAGRNIVANSLVEFLLKLEMTSNVTPWYSRVPSPSNISDEPSRGEVEALVEQGVDRVGAAVELSDILVVLRELVG